MVTKSEYTRHVCVVPKERTLHLLANCEACGPQCGPGRGQDGGLTTSHSYWEPPPTVHSSAPHTTPRVPSSQQTMPSAVRTSLASQSPASTTCATCFSSEEHVSCLLLGRTTNCETQHAKRTLQGGLAGKLTFQWLRLR